MTADVVQGLQRRRADGGRRGQRDRVAARLRREKGRVDGAGPGEADEGGGSSVAPPGGLSRAESAETFVVFVPGTGRDGGRDAEEGGRDAEESVGGDGDDDDNLRSDCSAEGAEVAAAAGGGGDGVREADGEISPNLEGEAENDEKEEDEGSSAAPLVVADGVAGRREGGGEPGRELSVEGAAAAELGRSETPRSDEGADRVTSSQLTNGARTNAEVCSSKNSESAPAGPAGWSGELNCESASRANHSTGGTGSKAVVPELSSERPESTPKQTKTTHLSQGAGTPTSVSSQSSPSSLSCTPTGKDVRQAKSSKGNGARDSVLARTPTGPTSQSSRPSTPTGTHVMSASPEGNGAKAAVPERSSGHLASTPSQTKPINATHRAGTPKGQSGRSDRSGAPNNEDAKQASTLEGTDAIASGPELPAGAPAGPPGRSDAPNGVEESPEEPRKDVGATPILARRNVRRICEGAAAGGAPGPSGTPPAAHARERARLRRARMFAPSEDEGGDANESERAGGNEGEGDESEGSRGEDSKDDNNVGGGGDGGSFDAGTEVEARIIEEDDVDDGGRERLTTSLTSPSLDPSHGIDADEGLKAKRSPDHPHGRVSSKSCEGEKAVATSESPAGVDDAKAFFAGEKKEEKEVEEEDGKVVPFIETSGKEARLGNSFEGYCAKAAVPGPSSGYITITPTQTKTTHLSPRDEGTPTGPLGQSSRSDTPNSALKVDGTTPILARRNVRRICEGGAPATGAPGPSGTPPAAHARERARLRRARLFASPEKGGDAAESEKDEGDELEGPRGEASREPSRDDIVDDEVEGDVEVAVEARGGGDEHDDRAKSLAAVSSPDPLRGADAEGRLDGAGNLVCSPPGAKKGGDEVVATSESPAGVADADAFFVEEEEKEEKKKNEEDVGSGDPFVDGAATGDDAPPPSIAGDEGDDLAGDEGARGAAREASLGGKEAEEANGTNLPIAAVEGRANVDDVGSPTLLSATISKTTLAARGGGGPATTTSSFVVVGSRRGAAYVAELREAARLRRAKLFGARVGGGGGGGGDAAVGAVASVAAIEAVTDVGAVGVAAPPPSDEREGGEGARTPPSEGSGGQGEVSEGNGPGMVHCVNKGVDYSVVATGGRRDGIVDGDADGGATPGVPLRPSGLATDAEGGDGGDEAAIPAVAALKSAATTSSSVDEASLCVALAAAEPAATASSVEEGDEGDGSAPPAPARDLSSELTRDTARRENTRLRRAKLYGTRGGGGGDGDDDAAEDAADVATHNRGGGGGGGASSSGEAEPSVTLSKPIDSSEDEGVEGVALEPAVPESHEDSSDRFEDGDANEPTAVATGDDDERGEVVPSEPPSEPPNQSDPAGVEGAEVLRSIAAASEAPTIPPFDEDEVAAAAGARNSERVDEGARDHGAKDGEADPEADLPPLVVSSEAAPSSGGEDEVVPAPSGGTAGHRVIPSDPPADVGDEKEGTVPIADDEGVEAKPHESSFPSEPTMQGDDGDSFHSALAFASEAPPASSLDVLPVGVATLDDGPSVQEVIDAEPFPNAAEKEKAKTQGSSPEFQSPPPPTQHRELQRLLSPQPLPEPEYGQTELPTGGQVKQQQSVTSSPHDEKDDTCPATSAATLGDALFSLGEGQVLKDPNPNLVAPATNEAKPDPEETVKPVTCDAAAMVSTSAATIEDKASQPPPGPKKDPEKRRAGLLSILNISTIAPMEADPDVMFGIDAEPRLDSVGEEERDLTASKLEPSGIESMEMEKRYWDGAEDTDHVVDLHSVNGGSREDSGENADDSSTKALGLNADEISCDDSSAFSRLDDSRSIPRSIPSQSVCDVSAASTLSSLPSLPELVGHGHAHLDHAKLHPGAYDRLSASTAKGLFEVSEGAPAAGLPCTEDLIKSNVERERPRKKDLLTSRVVENEESSNVELQLFEDKNKLVADELFEKLSLLLKERGHTEGGHPGLSPEEAIHLLEIVKGKYSPPRGSKCEEYRDGNDSFSIRHAAEVSGDDECTIFSSVAGTRNSLVYESSREEEETVYSSSTTGGTLDGTVVNAASHDPIFHQLLDVGCGTLDVFSIVDLLDNAINGKSDADSVGSNSDCFTERRHSRARRRGR